MVLLLWLLFNNILVGFIPSYNSLFISINLLLSLLSNKLVKSTLLNFWVLCQSERERERKKREALSGVQASMAVVTIRTINANKYRREGNNYTYITVYDINIINNVIGLSLPRPPKSLLQKNNPTVFGSNPVYTHTHIGKSLFILAPF